MGEATYSGWIVETIYNLQNKDPPIGGERFTLNTPSQNIVWDNNIAPDGWIPNTITTIPPEGYAYKIQIYYAVSGHWFSLVSDGPNNLVLTLWTKKFQNGSIIHSNRMDFIPVNQVSGGAYQDFLYGPPIVGGIVPPNYLANQKPGSELYSIPEYVGYPYFLQVDSRHGGTAAFYKIYNLTLQILTRIVVTRNCNTNPDAPICRDVCLANPNTPACYTSYKKLCIDGPNVLLNTTACYNYFQSFVRIVGTNADIDNARIKYCKKYKGFNDFMEKTNDGDVDRDLCACMISDPEKSDPNATLLYDNYFDSVVKQYPGFDKLGIKRKCVFPACAGSAFGYDKLAPTGCSVPQCINFATVNNDGTINGNVEINQEANCGTYTGISWFWLFIILIFVVIVLICLGVLFSRTSNLTSDKLQNKSSFVNSGTKIIYR